MVVLSVVDHAAAVAGGGVAADGAVGQRGRAVVVVAQAAARGGGVAADDAVDQRGRADVVDQAAAVPAGGVAADGAVGSVVVPLSVYRPPPFRGGVAADGAAVQRGRAAEVVQAAAAPAELPLKVQSSSVVVPRRWTRRRR